MLLDAAKKLIAEYWNEFENFSDFAYNGEHAFTKAENLFYDCVNDFVDYEPETLGIVSREELLDKIVNSQLGIEKTNLRCLLTLAIAWSLFNYEQKSKFTRLFTAGDRSEDATWSTIVKMHNQVDEIPLFVFSIMLNKHIDSIANVKWSESTLIFDEFNQEDLIEHFEAVEFVLAEAKTRSKYMYCTVLTLLTLEQMRVLVDTIF